MIYDLERFVTAQHGTYLYALRELRAGHKSTHWMWFIFPQLRALGHSPRAKLYGIHSLTEARAYLDHELLGKRLRHCAQLVAESKTPSPEALLSQVDALKLWSCMTLFALADPQGGIVFKEVLDKYYGGELDPVTLKLLSSAETAANP